MLQNSLLLITTFLFIFGWKITLLADLILIVSIAVSGFAIYRRYLVTERKCVGIAAVLGVLSVYSLIIAIVNGLLDYQIAARSLRALINFTGAMSLSSIYYQRFKYDFFVRVLRDIYLSIGVHAFLMLQMYLHQPFREAVYQMTGAYDIVNNFNPFMNGLRISGLTYGLSQTSVLQVCGLFLLPVLLAGINGLMMRTAIIVIAPLILVSVFISGRSGLMMAVLFIPVYLFTSIYSNWPSPDIQNCAYTRFIQKKLAGAMIIILLVSLTLVAIQLLPQKFFAYSLTQSKEVFAALLLSGPTIGYLAEMVVFPESWFEVIFGSSNLGRGSLDNIPSDIGWIKSVFALGLIGTILMVLPYGFALRLAAGMRFYNFELTAVCLMIFLSNLLLNFKELALLTRNQWSVHSLLAASLAIQLSLLAGQSQPD